MRLYSRVTTSGTSGSVTVLVALAGLMASAMMSGCAVRPLKVLAPHERTLLLTTVMSDSVDPLESLIDAHVVSTREVMLGATRTGGASCGCN